MKKILPVFLFAIVFSNSAFSINEKAHTYNFSDTQYQNGCVTTTDFNYPLPNNPPSGQTYVLHVWTIDEPFLLIETLNTSGSFQLNNFQININTIFSVNLYNNIGFVEELWSNKLYKCPNDFDLDGVTNSIDECPQQAGNAANFGCLGNPDFTILDNSYLWAPGWGSEFGDVSSSNRVELARYGGFMTVDPLLIKNIGNSARRRFSNVQFFISSDQILSSNDFRFTANTFSIPNLAPFETSPLYGSNRLKTRLEGSTVGNNLSYGNYYLLVILDPDNLLEGSELNTANNTYALPMTYTNYTSGPQIVDNKYLKTFYDNLPYSFNTVSR